MITIHKIEHLERGSNFTQISNKIVNNKNLSWKAKGIALGFLQHANDYIVYQTQLVKASKDGKKSVQAGMNELGKNGYLERVPPTPEIMEKIKARIDYIYIFHEEPNDILAQKWKRETKEIKKRNQDAFYRGVPKGDHGGCQKETVPKGDHGGCQKETMGGAKTSPWGVPKGGTNNNKHYNKHNKKNNNDFSSSFSSCKDKNHDRQKLLSAIKDYFPGNNGIDDLLDKRLDIDKYSYAEYIDCFTGIQAEIDSVMGSESMDDTYKINTIFSKLRENVSDYHYRIINLDLPAEREEELNEILRQNYKAHRRPMLESPVVTQAYIREWLRDLELMAKIQEGDIVRINDYDIDKVWNLRKFYDALLELENHDDILAKDKLPPEPEIESTLPEPEPEPIPIPEPIKQYIPISSLTEADVPF